MARTRHRHPISSLPALEEATASLQYMSRVDFEKVANNESLVGYSHGQTPEKSFSRLLPIDKIFSKVQPGEDGLLYSAKMDASGTPEWSSSRGIPVWPVYQFMVWKIGTEKKIGLRPIQSKGFLGRLLQKGAAAASALHSAGMQGVARGSALGNTLAGRQSPTKESFSVASTMKTSATRSSRSLSEALTMNEPFKRFVMRLYKENAANNQDLENTAMLVRFFGTPREIDVVDKALYYDKEMKFYDKNMPGKSTFKSELPALQPQLKQLHDKYYRQLTGLKPAFPPVSAPDDESNVVQEDTMTDAEKRERERLVKGMKSSADDFESRYPGRGKNVMYATATKRAMGEAPTTPSANRPQGYFVMGRDQSVAWTPTRDEAEKIARSLNYRGGTHYTVVADSKPKGQYIPLSAGTIVNVPHKGKMVTGKIVRYDKGDPHGSPFYVVDVGEYASEKIPVHKVKSGEVNQRFAQESHEPEYETYYGDDDDDSMDFEIVFDDDEVDEYDDQHMMLSQLDAIRSRASKLYHALKRTEIEDVPAWIQDKVSVSDHSLNAILDYFMYENTSLREAAESAEKEIPWMLQPAHIVARILGGVGYSPVGTKPEDVVNNAILAFLRGSHTTEAWKLAGAALNSVRDVAGINWNTELIKPAIAKAMGITEPGAEPAPEPEPEKKTKDAKDAEKPTPDAEPLPAPAPEETPKAPEPKEPEASTPPASPDKEETPKSPKAQKKDTDERSQSTNEALEIEIKVGKPMKDVSFAQKKDAALAFAEGLCPGMTPNGITPEQVVNNAVSTWFFKRSVPLEEELAQLGKALKVIDELGIQWNPHLVPAPYMAALKMPNVKVTEVEAPADTSAAGKKVDKLETILIDL